MGETKRTNASNRVGALALSAIGLVALLQIDPCVDERVGCGSGLGADGQLSCEEQAAALTRRFETDSLVTRLAVNRYLEELEAQGWETAPLSTEPPSAGETAAPTDEVARMEAYVLEYAEKAETGELIQVVLELREVPFPELETLRSMNPTDRASVLAKRKADIEREQTSLRQHLESLGATSTKPVGLLNHLQAWVPSSRMTDAANHPAVVAVYPAWQPVVALYDHEEVRQATFLSEFWELGLKGESSSNVCDPDVGYEDIKIAVIEPSRAHMFFPNRLNVTHPGWADCPSCESRVRAQYDCTEETGDPEACVRWTGEPQEIGAHGTWVASIAAGDVTQGQDPNTIDPDARLRRTGMAPEASVLYFTASSTGFVASAIMEAFILGADVINLSLGIPDCSHDLSTDCAGLNDVIRTVTMGGTLVVAAAGNENTSDGSCEPYPGCRICYPALRPEVVAVGNVDAVPGANYDEAELAETSSRGLARVGIAGGFGATFEDGVEVPLVSIATPGNICGYFSTDDGYDDDGMSGTSFAAPVVSGAAGLIREEQGEAVRDARMLKSHLLAMGDGTDAEEAAPGVLVGTSHAWGTGRAKFHPFAKMKSPKGMAHRSFRIREGEQHAFSAADTAGESFEENTTQWKMGMYVDSPSIDAIPYLLITYWNVCNQPRIVAADLNPGLERHAIVEDPAIEATCLEVRVYGYSVPEGGVEVFVTDYYHSGDPRDH